MSADQHNLTPPSGRPEPETAPPNPAKVRSSRYDWANDSAPNDPPKKSRGDEIAARRSLLRRMLVRVLDWFGSGRNPFHRDDDPDPMAA